MSDAPEIARRLLAHCYEDSPRGFIGQHLLAAGRFPPGWVRKYLELVREAEAQYGSRGEWPRELVAAVYNGSVYCQKRYRDWLQLHPGAERDPETEAALQEIRWAGDSLILGWLWKAQNGGAPE